MAISFIKDIPSTILTAYNNHIIEFFSDNELTPKYATLSFSSAQAVIYALPNGIFWFNFQSYIPYLINTNDFADVVEPEIVGSDLETYVYVGNNGKYLNFTLTIEITFSDNSTESVTRDLSFIAGVQQLSDIKTDEFVLNTDLFLLSQFIKESNVSYYLRYYKGYPFDFSYFSKDIMNIEITNNRNLSNVELTSLQEITRVFISDGVTDMNVENVLAIGNGLNPLSLTDGTNTCYIELETFENTCGGLYVKWINRLGGYSYWLFSDYFQKTRTYKNIGEINNDFKNVEDTFAVTKQIGKNTGEAVEVIEENLSVRDFNLLSDILESPKVQLFTGLPFSRVKQIDWIDIQVNTQKAIIRNFKNEPITIKFSFDLPDKFNITL